MKLGMICGVLAASLLVQSTAMAKEEAKYMVGVRNGKYTLVLNQDGADALNEAVKNSLAPASAAAGFSVEIEQNDAQVSGLKFQFAVTPYKDGEAFSKNHDVVSYKDNDERNMKMIVHRDLAARSDWRQWRNNNIKPGQADRRAITVKFLTDDGQEHSIVVSDATPVAYSQSRSDGHLIETLELVGHEIRYGK